MSCCCWYVGYIATLTAAYLYHLMCRPGHCAALPPSALPFPAQACLHAWACTRRLSRLHVWHHMNAQAGQEGGESNTRRALLCSDLHRSI